jgi:hypothetical protein
VGIPRAGAVAMMVALIPFAVALWNDGTVSRVEGLVLLAVGGGLMTWLYRRSPIFRGASATQDDHPRPGTLLPRSSGSSCLASARWCSAPSWWCAGFGPCWRA